MRQENVLAIGKVIRLQFKGTKEKVVTTLVERKSRMVYLIKNDRKYSHGVMDKIKEKFESLPQKMCKTITFDQGLNLLITDILSKKLNVKFIIVKHILLGKKEAMKI